MNTTASSPNVVARLRQRIADARRLGYRVRIEVLEDQQAGWCQVGKSKLIFIDLSQSAAEQLAQLDETLAEIAAVSSRSADASRAA